MLNFTNFFQSPQKILNFFSNCWTEDRSKQTLGRSKISTWNRILGLLAYFRDDQELDSTGVRELCLRVECVSPGQAPLMAIKIEAGQRCRRLRLGDTWFDLKSTVSSILFQSVCAFHLLLFSPILDWLPVHILFFHWTSILCASALPRVYEFVRKRLTRSNIFVYQFRVVESSKTFHPAEEKELYFFCTARWRAKVIWLLA